MEHEVVSMVVEPSDKSCKTKWAVIGTLVASNDAEKDAKDAEKDTVISEAPSAVQNSRDSPKNRANSREEVDVIRLAVTVGVALLFLFCE